MGLGCEQGFVQADEDLRCSGSAAQCIEGCGVIAPRRAVLAQLNPLLRQESLHRVAHDEDVLRSYPALRERLIDALIALRLQTGIGRGDVPRESDMGRLEP